MSHLHRVNINWPQIVHLCVEVDVGFLNRRVAWIGSLRSLALVPLPCLVLGPLDVGRVAD